MESRASSERYLFRSAAIVTQPTEIQMATNVPAKSDVSAAAPMRRRRLG